MLRELAGKNKPGRPRSTGMPNRIALACQCKAVGYQFFIAVTCGRFHPLPIFIGPTIALPVSR